MFFKFFFKRWPVGKQVDFLKKKGVLIGSRKRENRTIFIYMHQDLFAEVLFRNDTPEGEAENVNLVKGLKKLNNYLENEFKGSSF